jgi:HSP20 family protein
MRSRDFSGWMWGEAFSLLEQADRLHRQFCKVSSREAHCWEPPVDVIEAGEVLMVQVALPGVGADAITVGLETDAVTISALRAFPAREEGATIHRVEIPYGRFERRIGLPMDLLDLTGKNLSDGVLTLVFRRKEGT